LVAGADDGKRKSLSRNRLKCARRGQERGDRDLNLAALRTDRKHIESRRRSCLDP